MKTSPFNLPGPLKLPLWGCQDRGLYFVVPAQPQRCTSRLSLDSRDQVWLPGSWIWCDVFNKLASNSFNSFMSSPSIIFVFCSIITGFRGAACSLSSRMIINLMLNAIKTWAWDCKDHVRVVHLIYIYTSPVFYIPNKAKLLGKYQSMPQFTGWNMIKSYTLYFGRNVNKIIGQLV